MYFDFVISLSCPSLSGIFGHVVICMLALSAVRGQCTCGVSPAGKESKGRRGIRDVQ